MCFAIKTETLLRIFFIATSIQELERFANPLKAFTYKMHGYESVVGPLRGVYSTASLNVKPRGHSLLVSDRPNYVTILALGKYKYQLTE